MAQFKFVLVFLFFVLGLKQSFGQVYNFSTSGLSVLEKKQNGKWGDWSDLQLANLLIKLDTEKNRIIVYSEMIQVYEIIDYLPLKENETDLIYSFACKDTNGLECTLSIITRKKQGNRKQLYICFDESIIVYNIFNYD